MFRKLMFVLCAMSLTLASASCGRQVTPNRTGTSSGSGTLTVKFTTAGQMNFTNYWYVIAVNTEGPAPGTTTGEPYPFYGNQGQNWLNYSFEFIVFAAQGQPPQVAFYQFKNFVVPGQPPFKSPVQPGYTAGDIVLNPNCNGLNTQFCLQINRRVFAGIGLTSPSPSPSTSPSTSPSPTPTASPSSLPSGSPSPSPSSSPPSETPTIYVNWFTVTSAGNNLQNPQVNTGTVVDAPGPALNPISDTTWLPPNAPYDTATSFDVTWQAVLSPGGWTQTSDAAAQIAGGEVLNTP